MGKFFRSHCLGIERKTVLGAPQTYHQKPLGLKNEVLALHLLQKESQNDSTEGTFNIG
jgi:hypothetical protein